jgi:HEPN domain-containing protein
MPDSPQQRLSAQWLDLARLDLRAAQALLSTPDRQSGFAGIAAYHCQQAAEKSLKAVLAGQGERIVKTHDLNLLLDLVSGNTAIPDRLLDSAVRLSPFSTAYRYPNVLPVLGSDQP